MELVGVRDVEHADAEEVAPYTFMIMQPQRVTNVKYDREDISKTKDALSYRLQQANIYIYIKKEKRGRKMLYHPPRSR